jgi:hypothetical protein
MTTDAFARESAATSSLFLSQRRQQPSENSNRTISKAQVATTSNLNGLQRDFVCGLQPSEALLEAVVRVVRFALRDVEHDRFLQTHGVHERDACTLPARHRIPRTLFSPLFSSIFIG